jgi:hypothetical protein
MDGGPQAACNNAAFSAGVAMRMKPYNLLNALSMRQRSL